MGTPFLEVRDVWKRFRRGEAHDSLRDLIPALVRAIGKGRREDLLPGYFWALQDISFRVEPGEVLGIIGANGAGKSTLLKVLNRILRPERGTVTVNGRVGSLIEVAAGFHPDLTGRENVFLQGAILGMSRLEVSRKFEEIVDFSGIRDFIDTPVKRYSSGMNARLGFSIAIHMEPEVLLIDEVLAVGDFFFQQRAYERLSALAKGGIPVVLVSHQLNRIAELCSRAILLRGGRVALAAAPAQCIAEYIGTGGSGHAASGDLWVTEVTTDPAETVGTGDPLGFSLRVELPHGPVDYPYSVGLTIRSITTGLEVYWTTSDRLGLTNLPRDRGYRLSGSLQMNVAPGMYSLETWIWDAKHNGRSAAGPTRLLTVPGARNFIGEVQLNARLSLAES